MVWDDVLCSGGGRESHLRVLCGGVERGMKAVEAGVHCREEEANNSDAQQPECRGNGGKNKVTGSRKKEAHGRSTKKRGAGDQ